MFYIVNIMFMFTSYSKVRNAYIKAVIYDFLPRHPQRGPTHLGVFIYSVIKLHKQFDKKYMDKYFI
jgi:hypothetical protein